VTSGDSFESMYKRKGCQYLFRKSAYSFGGIELTCGESFVRKSDYSFGGIELTYGGMTCNVSA